MAANARGWFRLQDVLDAARGRWPGLLARLGVRSELLTGRHGPCPGCGGKDRFRFDDKNGEGSFLCSQGGAGNLAGNGIELLKHVHGWDWKRAYEEVGRLVLPDSARVVWDESRVESRAVDQVLQELPDEPEAERIKVPDYNEALLREYVRHVPHITREDIKRVSPMPVDKVNAADFFEALYADKERVLVFTENYSQGNFLYQCGSGSCRLSKDRGVKAVLSDLPLSGRNGVWYLCNPVNGLWEPGERKRHFRYVREGLHGPPHIYDAPAKWGRRSWRNVTSFRYAVLESDSAPEELWIRALVKLPVPIVAIYSSGGKSLHALIRIDAAGKPEWDRIVRGVNAGTHERSTGLMNLACPLGADPGAMTAVRLTRLPGCMREGTTDKQGGYKRYERPRLQELFYLASLPLNERPPWKSLETRHGSRAG